MVTSDPPTSTPSAATGGATDEPPMIIVDDVHMRFGPVHVLRGVSFEVKKGDTVCILGGSGGGKSTLLKCMIGVHRPTSGRVVINGHDIAAMNDRELDVVRAQIGVMFQGGALLNSLTVAENVALPLRFHTDLTEEVIETMVKIKLQQVDLRHAADRRPSALSGGMLKRAAVARALARDPKVIFYDEPSAGLDPIATTRIDHLINKLREPPFGMTNVVITHVLESVERIANQIVMLDQGSVILDGSYEDLMRSEDERIIQFRTGDVAGPTTGGSTQEDYLRDLLS